MLEDFLACEVQSKEMTEGILSFINSGHIRQGEFECNLHIIKKLNLSTFVIYQEYEHPNGVKEIGLPLFGIFRRDLQRNILERAKAMGISIDQSLILE